MGTMREVSDELEDIQKMSLEVLERGIVGLLDRYGETDRTASI